MHLLQRDLILIALLSAVIYSSQSHSLIIIIINRIAHEVTHIWVFSSFTNLFFIHFRSSCSLKAFIITCAITLQPRLFNRICTFHIYRLAPRKSTTLAAAPYIVKVHICGLIISTYWEWPPTNNNNKNNNKNRWVLLLWAKRRRRRSRKEGKCSTAKKLSLSCAQRMCVVVELVLADAFDHTVVVMMTSTSSVPFLPCHQCTGAIWHTFAPLCLYNTIKFESYYHRRTWVLDTVFVSFPKHFTQYFP